MIENEIIKITDLPQSITEEESVIPTWIKNNAGWWADGLIEERDFVNGIEYLVKNGVIQVN